VVFDRLPRRKRQIAWTGVLSTVLVVGADVIVSALSAPDEEYLPGEDVEGLTATLARDLPEDYPRVTFTDVAAEAGIDWRHFGGTRSSQLPEDMGSGAAWGDYDGDGWPDLFLVNIARPLMAVADDTASDARSALYRNLGDGTFRDVSAEAGIDHATTGMAAAWADYDGDGDLDLVVTAYGRNTLYRNEGDATFSDESAPTGVGKEVGFWTGAAWGDYDRDGRPDLYVTGYAQYSPGANAGLRALQYEVEVPASLNPSSFRPERNLLFHNEGDGTFAEVAARAGVEGADGRSLSAVWADFDADGWLDLYVANDVSDNALYRNRGDGTFENVSHAALVADYRGAMGLAVGDWDGDGDADLFITHWIAQENALFSSRLADGRSAGPADGRVAGRADGPAPADLPLQFLDEADRFGLGQIALDYVGWGTSFFDYDNDGRLDLFVANGSTFEKKDDRELLEPMTDQLFWNRGSEEGFYDVSPVGGAYFGERRVGRGAAFADYDRDGDVDVVVVNHGEAPSLLRNDGGNRASWLEIVLAGSPVGARVRLVAGGRAQLRWLGAQSSYLSQNSSVLHFGLGEATSVDTVEVSWPDGTLDTWTGIAARRAIRLAPGGAPSEELWAVTAAPDATAPDASLDDRERTRRFWERYRAATRHRTAGELREAAAAYAEANALDPGHEDALYYLAGVQGKLGDYEGALASLESLLEIDPRSGRGLVSLGALLACPAAGAPSDLDRARESFEAAEVINPEQVGPALWLGVVALLAGDLGESGRRLDHVLGSDRGNVAALLLRGYVDWKSGLPEAAQSRLKLLSDGSSAEFAGCAWLEETLSDVLARLHSGNPATAGVNAAGMDDAYRRLERRLARIIPG